MIATTVVVDLLKLNDIEALRFDGKMSRQSRDETLTKFKAKDGPRILIISLKCGGVGLNLVNANRCINLDLAWNKATENQVQFNCGTAVHSILNASTGYRPLLSVRPGKNGLCEAYRRQGYD